MNTNTEIVTAAEVAAADLQARAETINQTLDLIVMHEEAFEESTLEPRLIIGLEIAQAQALFGITNDNRQGIGGRPSETLPQRGTVSNPLGFSAWIGKNIPRLPRSTAQKYATAFKSLGLSTDHATPAAIRSKIKDIRHHCGKSNLPMPSLASLYKSGKPSKATDPETEALAKTPDPLELRIGDAKEFTITWIREWDAYVKRGFLEDLPTEDLPTVLNFLTEARDHVRTLIKSAKA